MNLNDMTLMQVWLNDKRTSWKPSATDFKSLVYGFMKQGVENYREDVQELRFKEFGHGVGDGKIGVGGHHTLMSQFADVDIRSFNEFSAMYDDFFKAHNISDDKKKTAAKLFAESTGLVPDYNEGYRPVSEINNEIREFRDALKLQLQGDSEYLSRFGAVDEPVYTMDEFER